MFIVINGVSRQVSEGVSVAGLLLTLDLAPIRVAVEINETLVRRASFTQTRLRDGDRVEVVTIVGGG